MEEIVIRQLEESDAAEFLDIRLNALKSNPEAFATTYKELMDSGNPLEQLKKQLKSDQSFTYGAFINKQLVAIATIRLYAIEKMKHKGMLLGMFVSDQTRGLGVGKRLMQEVVKEARKIGLEQIQLMVVTTNKAGKAFYESLGFETYGIENNAMKYNGEYWDEELMVLFL
ncbi:GNAT family N-acetyltransferase [Evansella cellulosilytica]|uniref:GCN5-related N-acetyltransferase n=1 Tax=Evansella cellulosilytica (strain ATCC 21833 / DSM 2522 / FERM P-1141 / JCM 9156 / N-4) TaxID=649639 RepID=E6TUY3_EVAC2|nr:GNAT family N-acetyltransferase [Evansella cellulosilytica]ADU28566.1 GCN5-related N-acetyltransferase [Evansella cellulosilytica DSM 2522]